MTFRPLILVLNILAASFSLLGCGNSPVGIEQKQRVVIYTALDRQFSEPILSAFEKESGIQVDAIYDTEAVKTVGLVNRLISERERPTADLFWNNEIIRSLQLKEQGLTTTYSAGSASGIPTELKDPEGHWVGFASRVRVILVNTELIPNEADYPTTVSELTNMKWKGKAGFASPLYGTTSTHAAILWATKGGEETLEFFRKAKANAVMYAGNAQARDAVANGEIAWCLTDSDDAFGALEDGKPVRMIYPDSKQNEAGVVVIPNTLVKIAKGPNPEAADKLLNYLLDSKVEETLAQSRSAQIPVREGLTGPQGIPSLSGAKIQSVDWTLVQQNLEECQKGLAQLLQEP